MKIGELSHACATPVETIRYYERAGLLPQPARSQGNFRVYAPEHVERLQFIRFCRSLDMSLDEVRVLLHWRDAPAGDCARVNDLIDAHIGHVSQRIDELRSLQLQLRDLRERCGQVQPAHRCGILTGLSEASHDHAPALRESSHLRPVHGH